MFLQPYRRLFVPVVLLVIALVLREQIDRLDTDQQQLLVWLPYVTLGIATLLSVYYNRVRLFTLSLVFIIAYYIARYELQVSLSDPHTLIVYTATSFFLPVSIFLLCFLPERGLINRYGALVLSIIPIQFIIFLIIINIYPEATIISVIRQYLPTHPGTDYVLSIYGSLFYLMIALSGLFLLYKKNDETIAVLFVTIIIAFITFAYFHLQDISIVMFSVTGLIIVVGLLRSSFDMAYRDELTGLLGRRALNERLKGLGKRYVIAMTDVDHFKKFNDTYGHDVGDEVLKVVAKQLAAVKGGGIAYRYGGEEFCIVFSGKDIEFAKPYLEEVRIAVEKYKMALRDSKHRPRSEQVARERRGRRSKNREGQTVSVTISIGVAAPDENKNKADAVIKAADQALYKAKQNGRNCLAVSS